MIHVFLPSLIITSICFHLNVIITINNIITISINVLICMIKIIVILINNTLINNLVLITAIARQCGQEGWPTNLLARLAGQNCWQILLASSGQQAPLAKPVGSAGKPGPI